MCSCSVKLLPVSIKQNSPLDGYKYVYVTPTSGIISTTGSMYSGKYVVSSSTETRSTNPSEIIAGFMFKKGFVQIPHITPALASQTLIINYGESGRRQVGLAYTIEVTLQFLSAQTHEVICISTAEGCGSTEADDIRIAINRALEETFSTINIAQ